ncbi:hypothetical protein [Maribacter sp. Asnod2-G09]|uniref:hypothetical protein n=1 Tax=Maribacter sp. Asnod2-G09 TaxID=3160577 RepID=UPI00386B287A
MKEKIKDSLVKLLGQFVDENEIELNKEINLDENIRLIGTSSIFDSMELVQFIVEVESLLDDEFEINIELTSEKAMSRRNSPFISINTLLEYIVDES